ncbi:sulfotransferase [Microcystis elabens FACHB-917]|nr:sulfotransferase [Microcystis elabens FACHB-917]
MIKYKLSQSDLSRAMINPNFFIIGAQKTATTYLSVVLSRHKDVFFSNPKEIFFFDQRTPLTHEKYEDYCKKYFQKEAACVGEGSTTYLQSPIAPINIMKYVPGKPKFIICLRHPLEKAVSYFIHNWRRGRYAEGVTIIDAGRIYPTLSPFLTSIYSSGVKCWMDVFSADRSRFLFLQQEQLSENSDFFISQATNFLSLSKSTYRTSNRVNRGLKKQISLDNKGLYFNAQKEDTVAAKNIFISFDELYSLYGDLARQTDEMEHLTGLDLHHWRIFPY